MCIIQETKHKTKATKSVVFLLVNYCGDYNKTILHRFTFVVLFILQLYCFISNMRLLFIASHSQKPI